MKQARAEYATVGALLAVLACSSEPSPTTPDQGSSEADDTPAERDDALPDAGAVTIMDASASPRADASARAPRDASATPPLPADASVGSSAPIDALRACTQTLKARCRYDEKDTACSSITTPLVPLSDGGTWGDVAIPSGPHGYFMAWNQGKAFENPVSLLENACDIFAAGFGEPESVTREVLDLRGAELSLYTVFRPACMRDGETYPVITWGNGTCGQTVAYAPLLATLASHGFVVFAANSRFTNGGNEEMRKALDFAQAINADATSPLYQRLDLEHVGAMGHSQGAAATASVASDPRVDALILWNGNRDGSPAKPFLFVSGDRDIGNPSVASASSFVASATQPGAWLFYHQVLDTGGYLTGHLTLMEQPERATDVTIAWWKYMLLGDLEAKRTFVGPDCKLCGERTAFEYGERGLR